MKSVTPSTRADGSENAQGVSTKRMAQPPSTSSPGEHHRSPKADASVAASAEHLLVLEPGRADRDYWSDLWSYRELFIILAWRDVAIQYKQSVIGVAWALVRPLLTMIIFTVVFGRIAKMPSEGAAPYPVMVMTGMLPWFLFSTVLSGAANSLVLNQNLVSKIYFPRLVVPVASAAVAVVDFVVGIILLLGMMVLYGFGPDWRLAFVPLAVLLAAIASLGPGLILASLNVKYRDFRFIVPFIVQFGLYVSPVGFASSVVPQEWRLLYSLNPAVGVIDAFRWCTLAGASQLYVPGFLLSIAVAAISLWLGVTIFRKTEKSFADLV